MVDYTPGVDSVLVMPAQPKHIRAFELRLEANWSSEDVVNMLTPDFVEMVLLRGFAALEATIKVSSINNSPHVLCSSADSLEIASIPRWVGELLRGATTVVAIAKRYLQHLQHLFAVAPPSGTFVYTAVNSSRFFVLLLQLVYTALHQEVPAL